MQKKKNIREPVCEIAKALFLVLAVCAVCWLLWGCSGRDDGPVTVENVLLVYLAGDNNLSGESYDKLEAIRRGYSAKPCSRLLVYHDAKDAVPSLLEITDGNSIKTIELFNEEDSADPQVFSRVIRKAKDMYPGARFNLLVFSHASGWLPPGSLSNPKSAQAKSVLMDGNNEMALTDFAAAIPDNSFDYIVFEACFMAGIEVAYQLRDKARYIAASSAEIVSPGFTPVYAQYINELVYGDPPIFMQEAFNSFDSQTGYMRSATFSLVRMDKLETLASFVKQNCDFSKQSGTGMADIQYFDRNSYRLFCDFEDYYSSLLQTDGQKLQLRQLITDCVVWKAATPYFMQGYNGFAIEKHSGLTGYIMQDRYPQLNDSYRELEWYKAIR